MTFGRVQVPSERRQIAPKPFWLEEMENLVDVSTIQSRSEGRHPLVDNINRSRQIHRENLFIKEPYMACHSTVAAGLQRRINLDRGNSKVVGESRALSVPNARPASPATPREQKASW
jgi:hypothetical protein